MKREKKNNLFRKIVVALLLAGGGAVIGYLVGTLLGNSNVLPEGASRAVFLVALLPLLFAVVAWHEAGHLLAGRLAGLQPMLLIVGPLEIRWANGTPRLGLNRTLALYGGLAAAAPRTTARLRQRMMMLVAGGPGASVLLALVAGGAGLALRQPTPTAALLLLFTGLASGVIALITLLPLPAGGFTSDGAQLLLYARGGAAADLRLRLVMLQTALMGGTRPRDLDANLVTEAVKLADGGDPLSRISARLYGYYHALDRGEQQRAGTYLEQALAERDAFPDGFRQALDLEAAYFYARHRSDAQRAAARLAEGTGGVVEAHTRARAEAAVAWIQGDVIRARQLAQEGLSTVDHSVDRGTAQAEAAWLRELADRPVPAVEAGSS